MKTKKLVMCLFAGLLSLTLLTACSKQDANPTDTTEGSSVTTQDGSEPVTSPEQEETTAGEIETTEPETYPDIQLPADPAGVMELINSIPEGSLENEWDIDRAYAAWAQLSEADRAKVTNYDRLRELLQQVADAHVVKDYHDTRIPHGELLLGAYFGPTPTDEKLQTAVDAYLDFFCGVSNDTATLDQYKKYGLGAIVGGGSFGVGDLQGWGAWQKEGLGSLSNAKPLQTMVNAVPQVVAKDHEAIWGIDFRDEPGASDFWWYADVIGALNDQYTSVQTFANLLPNYAAQHQLGTYGYNRHLMDYAYRVNGNILSIDHYMLSLHDQVGLLLGLESMAGAVEHTDKDIMIILQLNRNGQDRLTTLGEVKFQAYASMAYGAKYLVWGCYNGGWFNSQALDGNQEPTEQYYKMQECNADLKVLSPVYMRYTVVDQTVLNPLVQHRRIASNAPLDGLGIKTITDIQNVEGAGSLLMGYYEKNVGEGEAFLFVNTSTFDYGGTNVETSVVTFKTASPASVVTAYVKGVPTILTPVDGVYTVRVVDADAVFVTVTEPASLNKKPVAAIGSLTIGGVDISEFSIVIPANATDRERQAAEAMAALVYKATLVTLPIVTDAETPANGIYLGNTTQSIAALNTAVNGLKNDGYAMMTDGAKLFIRGKDAAGAGTLYGVYAFLEEYLNISFYADGYVAIPASDSIAVTDVNKAHSPSFAFRETTNYVAMDQPYPLYQKYNGYTLYGDVNFAAAIYGGQGLYRLCGINDVQESTVICLSNEATYATALANAKLALSCDPAAEYLACDIDLSGSWNPCSCDTCTATTAAEGTTGLILRFVNRLAADIQTEYPNVVLYTSAAGENMGLPTTVRPANNVGVRVVMPMNACRFHALNDQTCDANAALRSALEAWTGVCDHVILLDQTTDRAGDVKLYAHFSENLLALYDTVRYLRDLGVEGYQQSGYDDQSGSLEALYAYLLSRLLWDADMTREAYSAEIDGFLQAYYGAAAPYVRQYIDKIYTTDGVLHSDYNNSQAMVIRKGDSDFGAECFGYWKSAIEAADSPMAIRNTELSAIQMRDVAQSLRDRNYTSYFASLITKYGFSTK